MLLDVKPQINLKTVIVGDFSVQISLINRSFGQKRRKEINIGAK